MIKNQRIWCSMLTRYHNKYHTDVYHTDVYHMITDVDNWLAYSYCQLWDKVLIIGVKITSFIKNSSVPMNTQNCPSCQQYNLFFVCFNRIFFLGLSCKIYNVIPWELNEILKALFSYSLPLHLLPSWLKFCSEVKAFSLAVLLQ